MNQQAFQNVPVASQMRPSHPAGIVEMRERPFDQPAAPPHQAPAPRPPIRRRLAYTGVCASGCSVQSRWPRSGSATYDRTPTAARSTIVWLL